MQKKKRMRARWLVVSLFTIIFSGFSTDFSGAEEAKCSMSETGNGNENADSSKLDGQKEADMLNDVEWHRKKWQDSPAIIDISDRGVNLLFNRPEKVFALRRGIFFSWEDEHEFSDDNSKTIYKVQRKASDTALISFISQQQSPETKIHGSFVIRKK